MYFWDRMPGHEAPRDEKSDVKELIELLQQARAQGRSCADFIDFLSARETAEAGKVLLKDFETAPADYKTFKFEIGTSPWKTMSKDEAGSQALARKWLAEEKDGKRATAQVRLALRPLAYGTLPASAELVMSALASDDPGIRAEAARCLLVCGQPGAAKVFIAAAIQDPLELENLEPLLAGKLILGIDASLELDLLTLAKHWPGEIKQGKTDRAAIAAVTVRAALAKATPDKHLKEYEQAMDQYLASHPETDGGYHLRLLTSFAYIYYVPYIGKQLRPLLEQPPDEYDLCTTIKLLAEIQATDLGEAIGRQGRRPAPWFIKETLCNAAGKLPITGIEPAMQKWKSSSNALLAESARDGLKRLKTPASLPATRP
jgi:hypothetical protein